MCKDNIQIYRLKISKVDGTGSRLYIIVIFGISGVEPSRSIIRVPRVIQILNSANLCKNATCDILRHIMQFIDPEYRKKILGKKSINILKP
jgi:hypothetical protein